MTRRFGLGRLGIWSAVVAAVVLATRTIVYALAPESALLAALAHNRAGPDLAVPLVAAVLIGAGTAAGVLWLAALAVRERIELEGRRLAVAPRLRPGLLAMRFAVLSAVTSFAFAIVESTIHWHDGLGWHGLHCLTGPVHRDAIPVLVALSLVAVAVHGAIEHLLAWARRLFAQLASGLRSSLSLRPATFALLHAPRSRVRFSGNARGPPSLGSVTTSVSLF